MKRCPFCNSAYCDVIDSYCDVVDSVEAWVVCLDCGAEGPIANGRQAAIDKWNNRPREGKQP